jgi:hypothetical protein
MSESGKPAPSTLSAMRRAWFALTRDEQRAMLLVLGLLLLGLTVWAFRRGGSQDRPEPRGTATALPPSRSKSL